MSPVVVKVGGSLFDLPGLGGRLGAWLTTLPGREVILVPGGGAAADAVRDLDRLHALGEERSHWLALRSLTLTAHLLAAVFPSSGVTERLDECPRLWDAGTVPVLDMHAFAVADEGRPGCLPHGWAVTSDSLAARVAHVAGAGELVLLKSATMPEDMDWEGASRGGFVDGYFATAARGLRVRWVNLRRWPG
jgi:aspartokinase-like uncharacterized kinase